MQDTRDRWREAVEIDRMLRVGLRVRVFWGWGLGFRAEGEGTVVAINRKSVQVKLERSVTHHRGTGAGSCWPAGFVLKGIPRLQNDRWVYQQNGVEPFDPQDREAVARKVKEARDARV